MKSELAHFRRRQLGFVFQDFNLLDTLTVAENIVLPLTLTAVRSRTWSRCCSKPLHGLASAKF